MRDEIDGRIWVDHHEQFSDGIDDFLGRMWAAAAWPASRDGSTVQLVAFAAASLITALTFGTTSA